MTEKVSGYKPIFIYNCKYCNREFNHKPAYFRHEKVCNRTDEQKEAIRKKHNANRAEKQKRLRAEAKSIKDGATKTDSNTDKKQSHVEKVVEEELKRLKEKREEEGSNGILIGLRSDISALKAWQERLSKEQQEKDNKLKAEQEQFDKEQQEKDNKFKQDATRLEKEAMKQPKIATTSTDKFPILTYAFIGIGAVVVLLLLIVIFKRDKQPPEPEIETKTQVRRLVSELGR